MCSGVWPPSKRAETWYRAPVPLVPRPALLPLLPSPRPTRVLAVLAPGAGRRWWTLSGLSLAMSVDLLVRHEVSHGRDDAADLGSVLLDDDVADALEAERAQRLPLVLLPADRRAGLGHLEPRHHAPVPAARARSIAAGATCSSESPRRAATASGRSRPRSAATVAWTMLMALDEPSDLLSTSWMPAHSSTARTGPPAMTPVPGDAGRRNTTPAAASPWMGCGMVPWMRGTRKKFFLASSTPLAIAAGTSLALPLIETTRSRNALFSGASPRRPPSRRPPSRRSPPPPAPPAGAPVLLR